MLKKWLFIILLVLLPFVIAATVIPLYDPGAIRQDGSKPLTGHWNVGNYDIRNVEDINASGAGRFDGGISVGGDVPAGTLGHFTGTSATLLKIFLQNIGGGDAAIGLLAGSQWTFGVDNSDGDKFKISSSNVLETDTRLAIDTSGNIVVGGTFNGVDISTHATFGLMIDDATNSHSFNTIGDNGIQDNTDGYQLYGGMTDLRTLTVTGGDWTLNQSVASGASPTLDGTNFTGIPAAGVTNAVSATANITDHSLVRGHGGAKVVQGSGIIIDDSDNVSGMGTLGCGEVTVADGSSINLQEAITFLGATTENLIEMPDNLANALSFMEGANAYLTFVTTNNSEAINITKQTRIRTDTSLSVANTGDLEIISDDTYPSGKAFGVSLEHQNNLSSTGSYGGGVFYEKSTATNLDGNYFLVGLFGGANPDFTINTSMGTRSYQVTGLQFSAHNLNTVDGGTDFDLPIYRVKGAQIQAKLGYSGKSILGDFSPCELYGLDLQVDTAGTLNSNFPYLGILTPEGVIYGIKLTMTDGFAVTDGSFNTYGLHITAMDGIGGTGTGWGIYSTGASNNAIDGNLRVGSVVAPTVALDVTGAALISTTLGVTGVATFSDNVIINSDTASLQLGAGQDIYLYSDTDAELSIKGDDNTKDIKLLFESGNEGSITWMEDELRFDYDGHIQIAKNSGTAPFIKINTTLSGAGDEVYFETNYDSGGTPIRARLESKQGLAQVGTFTAHDLDIVTNSTNRMTVSAAGYVRVINRLMVGADSAPSLTFEVSADSIRIINTQSPASNGAGTQGEIAWDADYIYVCTATNAWERAALTGGY